MKLSNPVRAAMAVSLVAAVASIVWLSGEVHQDTTGVFIVRGRPGPSASASVTIEATPPASAIPAAGASVPPTRPTPEPSQAPGNLTLTESSSGGTFEVHAGQRVTVVLPGDGRQYHGYTAPTSSNPATLRPDTTRACSAAAGDFCTSFVAASTGSADLSSTTDPACRAVRPPCGVPSRLWRVTIRVT